MKNRIWIIGILVSVIIFLIACVPQSIQLKGTWEFVGYKADRVKSIIELDSTIFFDGDGNGYYYLNDDPSKTKNFAYLISSDHTLTIIMDDRTSNVEYSVDLKSKQLTLDGLVYRFSRLDSLAITESETVSDQAVAVVNGARITKNQFAVTVDNYYSNIDTYNMYALYYGYGTYYDTSTESGMKNLKNDILNELIEEEVYIQMAKNLGITLTVEEQAETAQEAQDALTSLKEQILQSARSSGSQNPETRAATMLSNYFSDMGIDEKTFLDYRKHSALAQKYAAKLQEHFANQRNVTEEELPELYAEYVKEHYQDAYSDGSYSLAESYVAQGYTDIPYLYIPEDFIFVRVIQLSDKVKATDTLQKIQDGEDFETYFASDNNENETGKALGDKPQAIGENDSAFDATIFTEASAAAISDVVMVSVDGTDSDGNDTTTWYIVKRMEGTTGVVPYEEVKDVIDSTLKSHEENEYYSEQLDAWREKAQIVIDDDMVNAFDPAA